MLRASTSSVAIMDSERTEEEAVVVADATEVAAAAPLYRCARCRGELRCSCSHLGLLGDDDDNDVEYYDYYHCCDNARERTRWCGSAGRKCRWWWWSTTTTGHRADCRCRDEGREYYEYELPPGHRRGGRYSWRWRKTAEVVDGGEVDDVLRRRPPERAGGGAAPGDHPYARTRRKSGPGLTLPSYLAMFLILSYSIVGVADACSSRSTPKPRPPTPTPRPNITFHMYACPPDYAEWYCLNGATCFTVKIVESLLYNCLCANGYIGQRCEFKDLDGSYLPSRQRVMLETASIAGAVTIAVVLAVITFISVYIHCKRKQKELRTSSGVDAVDGPARDPELRPFCSRSRSLMHFMAKNPNSSMTTLSIEKTRMPNWNSHPAEPSTRLTSVNENKRPPSQ